MSKEDKPLLPVRVIKGRVVRAVYRKPECPEFEGNPLVESMPPLMTDEQIAKRLQFYPKFPVAQRNQPDHIRFLLIQNGMRFFAPLDIHIDLARRVSNLVRMGYAGRNPMVNEFHGYSGEENKSFDQYADQYKDQPDQLPSTIGGFNIVGPSGVGKSFSVERVLNPLPQVIHHSKHRGRKFTCSQLVWLKVDCPFDGNPRGLCQHLFKAVDRILGTKYEQNYGGRRLNQGELLSAVEAIAENHYLGVLVIDEIQRLSLARSGGADQLLNFFGQLRNESGVPVILVGNFKAIGVLSGDFSQMRRGTGQGDLVWDLMDDDEQWHTFCESLWKFQYTKKTCSLEQEEKLTKKDLEKDPARVPLTLCKVLYEETQGITDFAVKVFMFAQERAIESGKEVITAAIIRTVAKEKLKIPRAVLQALKTKDKEVLALYEDLYYKEFKAYLYQQGGNVEVSGRSASSPEIKEVLEEQAQARTEAQGVMQPEIQTSTKEESSRKKPRANRRSKKIPASEKGELPSIVSSLTSKDGNSAYEALKQAGYIDSSGAS